LWWQLFIVVSLHDQTVAAITISSSNQTVDEREAATTTNQQQPRPTVMSCTCNEPKIRLRKYIEARQQSADFLPFNRGLMITQQKTINRRHNRRHNNNITTTAVMTTTMINDQRSLFIDPRRTNKKNNGRVPRLVPVASAINMEMMKESVGRAPVCF
jgi:hypothetical protein